MSNLTSAVSGMKVPPTVSIGTYWWGLPPSLHGPPSLPHPRILPPEHLWCSPGLFSKKKNIFGLPPISVRFGPTEVDSDFGSVYLPIGLPSETKSEVQTDPQFYRKESINPHPLQFSPPPPEHPKWKCKIIFFTFHTPHGAFFFFFCSSGRVSRRERKGGRGGKRRWKSLTMTVWRREQMVTVW